MRVLVLNAGSSSLKASVLETIGLQTLARTEVSLGTDATRSEARRRSVNDVLQALRQSIDLESVGAVGHRVVHGGTRFRTPVRIDADVLAGVEALTEFAPLHNRVAADTIRAAQSAFPSLPQVAAFDTAFHASLPPAGFVYPVPYRWYEEWGIRRFGFHGLSVTWALERAGALLGKPSPELGVVVAHLGSGCSVTAVWRGQSVDTSMGLTPLEGLMMGTRAGSVDPGILIYVLRTGRVKREELEDQLDHQSGLVGVSGRAAGMRELEQAATGGDKRARLAIEIFIRKAAAGIAAAATALPQLDAVVFTGGIGEHSGRTRAAIVSRLAVLGVQAIGDGEVTEDAILSAAGAGPEVLRIEAREDVVIARQVEAAL
ncbi:MAG TPA: acetate/propionate family kinase [Candidatus Dormibacteraeota bacterium]|nr:acetate/propionate family kinase [Candidatus Dormibacteraeota bacterium]